MENDCQNKRIKVEGDLRCFLEEGYSECIKKGELI